MFIDKYAVKVNKGKGKIYLKGQFLLLVSCRSALDIIRMRGMVKHVTAQTVRGGLKGRLRLSKTCTIRINAVFGNGIEPLFVPSDIYKQAEPMPAPLYKMYQVYKANPQDMHFIQTMQKWGQALNAWQAGEPRDKCFNCGSVCSTGGPCILCTEALLSQPLVLRPQGIESGEGFGWQKK